MDSAKGDNDFTLFRNLFNDFYAKDTSKKVRAIKKAQGMAGEHLTKPPYGYKVDPNDRKKWIVDEEAAAVVKRIFDLCVAGKGPMQIAKILKADKVLTTRAHYAKQKGKSSGRFNNRLLCEVIKHPDFVKLMTDTEIYVDGIATMQIKNMNDWLDAVRLQGSIHSHMDSLCFFLIHYSFIYRFCDKIMYLFFVLSKNQTQFRK